MNRTFIVKEHWGNLILDGLKPWEIRGTGTQVRGRVGVIWVDLSKGERKE